MLLRSNFSSFPQYIFNRSLTSGVKLHIHLLNVVVRFIGFLTSATLIFRCTDISKCFRESFGIRDNESRLYLYIQMYGKVLPICLSRSAASSGVALGMTPGSLKLVRNNVAMTKTNKAPPTAGMAGVTCSAR